MTESKSKTRRLGYAHVSTYGQTLDAQLEQPLDRVRIHLDPAVFEEHSQA